MQQTKGLQDGIMVGGVTTTNEVITKFDEYFEYALDQYNLRIGDPTPQCQLNSECSQGVITNCCANVVMVNPVDNVQHSIFRCMNEKVAAVAFDLEIQNFRANMQCVSGAAWAKISMATMAIASVIALY